MCMIRVNVIAGQVGAFGDLSQPNYRYPYLFRMQRLPDPYGLLKGMSSDVNHHHYHTGSCITSTLTKEGYEQWLQIGSNYRRVYVDELHLISPSYRPEQVFLRAHNQV